MRKAFTIIEVIITFIILSILIFFAIYSFRFSIKNIKNAAYYLPQNAIAFSALDRILGGIFYFVIEKKPKEFVFYFKGDDKQIEFITTSPLFTEELTLVKLQFNGSKLLYTGEKLYHKKSDIQKPKLTKKATTSTLIDQVQTLNISYISSQGETLSHMQDQIPKGIVIKFTSKGKNYHLIFAPSSDFLYNKVRVYHEKYPI